MKTTRRLSLVGLLSLVAASAALLATGAAQASKAQAPRDGYYAKLDSDHGSADLELFVIDDGTRVADTTRMTVGVSCTKNSAEEEEGLNQGAEYVNVYLPLGRTLAIKGGSFSYSGPARLGPGEVPEGVKQPAGTITISGTFKPAAQIKGKKYNDKIVALRGTASASLCPPTPTKVTDYWSDTD